MRHHNRFATRAASTLAILTALVLLFCPTHAYAATAANIPYLKPEISNVPSIPDLTKGDSIGRAHDWNLGPTGARGWMWGWLLRTDLARQIYITKIDAGSPAASVLKVGDVLLGLNGGLFTSDARIALSNAITEAEKTANNGLLRLTRWRNGTTTTVTITLPVMGDYSQLSPVGCSKSSAIMQRACAHIVSKGLGSEGGYKEISNYVNALGLLATGDTQYSAILRTYARQLVPRTTFGSWNWDPSYMSIFLCEYYLVTGDAEVLPEINQLANFLANSQNLVGAWGHAARMPNGNIGGYGALNQVGLAAALALTLSKKCGVANSAVDLANEKAKIYFRRFVDTGTIPYGDHAPVSWHDDNGRNSLAAVFFDLNGEGPACTYFGQMTVASYGERDLGHTGNYWSYLWGPLGALRSGTEGAAAFLREQHWFFDLERRWDGGFQYQGGADMGGPGLGRAEHQYEDWDVTGARVLMYAMPLKKLYITGKSASSMTALTGAALDKTIQSGRDFNYWYALNQLTRDSYDDLSVAELLTRLDSWSNFQRDRAAKALSRKASPPIASYRSMLMSSNRNTKLGGLFGLMYMGTAALPAMNDVSPLLASSDIWIQFHAGKVLCGIGAPARYITLPVEFNVASSSTDPNDPRRFRQRLSSYVLWGNGYDELSPVGILGIPENVNIVSLVPAVRSTIRHEHAIPRTVLSQWFEKRNFNELAPFWFDLRYAVENQAPTAVMFNHDSRNICLQILAQYRFKETVDAAATYIATQKNHGAEYRVQEILNVLISFGTEAKRVLPKLYAARLDFQENWGEQKPYDFPNPFVDRIVAQLDAAIATIEATTMPPGPLKTIYDYSIVVLEPPTANPIAVKPGISTTLSITAVQGEDQTINYTWSKVSGPGNVIFGSANARQTTATCNQEGIYVFRVTMEDSFRRKTADMSVSVVADDETRVAFTTSGQSSTKESGTMIVTAQLSAASGLPVTVPFTVSGTATLGTDYTISASPITIPAGSMSGHATITINDDKFEDVNETVILTLGTPTNAKKATPNVYTATISDDDIDLKIGWASASSSGPETTTAVSLPVVLSAASTQTVTVTYDVVGGTATGGGVDYTLARGVLTFPPGTTAQSIPMTVVSDGVIERDETVHVRLIAPANATLGAPDTHVYTITNPTDGGSTGGAGDESGKSCGLGSGLGAFSLLAFMLMLNNRDNI